MVNIPLLTGFYTSQVVVWDFWTINSIIVTLHPFLELHNSAWSLATISSSRQPTLTALPQPWWNFYSYDEGLNAREFPSRKTSPNLHNFEGFDGSFPIFHDFSGFGQRLSKLQASLVVSKSFFWSMFFHPKNGVLEADFAKMNESPSKD